MSNRILEELREMRDIYKETQKESQELQKDLICYFNDKLGNIDDLKTRMEIYLFAYKIYCRRPILFKNDSLKIPLNTFDLPFEKLLSISKQFNKFNITLSSEIHDNFSVLNLDLSLKH